MQFTKKFEIQIRMSQEEGCDYYHGKLSRIDAENVLLEGETDVILRSENIAL